MGAEKLGELFLADRLCIAAPITFLQPKLRASEFSHVLIGAPCFIAGGDYCARFLMSMAFALPSLKKT